jgi:hypothetical protein
MPRFVPTDEQRSFVGAMAGFKNWEDMRHLIINPRTQQPISRETLQKAFAAELAAGKALLQTKIQKSYLQLLEDRHWWAVHFGLTQICGYDKAIPTFNGNAIDVPAIEVTFVSPTRRQLPDDERPRDVTPYQDAKPDYSKPALPKPSQEPFRWPPPTPGPKDWMR